MIRRRKPLKRTPIKRKKVSYLTKKQTKPVKSKRPVNQRDFHIQDLIFNERIWNAREHVCANCGVHLPSPFIKTNFSHFLVKKTYRKIRYLAANIDLLCIACHNKWEFGDRNSMKIYDPERRHKLMEIDRSVPNDLRTPESLYLHFLMVNITSNWSSS